MLGDAYAEAGRIDDALSAYGEAADLNDGIARSLNRDADRARFRSASNDVLGVEEGALYPALHRLEVRGWLLATWGISDHGRRAKFYRLSALGRRELLSEAEHWRRVAGAVTRVMQAT